MRGGEGVLLLALNLFLLLAAYYLLKTVREVLILTQGGTEVKSYSAAARIVLLGAVPLFGPITSRVNRIRLVTGVPLFFVSNLAIFAALGSWDITRRALFSLGRHLQRDGHRTALRIC